MAFFYFIGRSIGLLLTIGGWLAFFGIVGIFFLYALQDGTGNYRDFYEDEQPDYQFRPFDDRRYDPKEFKKFG